MALTILDTVSEPGGSKPNEDRVGAGPCGAWVLDGATDVYSEAFLPAHNDVHFLVDHLDGLLAGVTATSVDSTADALLPELADAMGKQIAAHGFPPERTHPTCSLGLLLDHGASLELARIGDATLIAAGKQTVELSTDFYNHREAAAVSAAGSAGLTTPNARQALLERRREYITGVHAEGVFSGDPAAKLRVHRRMLNWDEVDHVLLCTDGFARAITDYQLFPDWPALIEAALGESLAAIAKTIRDIEHHPDTGAVHRHFKRSDDLAATLCTRG